VEGQKRDVFFEIPNTAPAKRKRRGLNYNDARTVSMSGGKEQPLLFKIKGGWGGVIERAVGKCGFV